MRVSTNPIAVPRAFAVASVALFLVIAATGSGPATAQSGSLAGVYDGGQMEIAAAQHLSNRWLIAVDPYQSDVTGG